MTKKGSFKEICTKSKEKMTWNVVFLTYFCSTPSPLKINLSTAKTDNKIVVKITQKNSKLIIRFTQTLWLIFAEDSKKEFNFLWKIAKNLFLLQHYYYTTHCSFSSVSMISHSLFVFISPEVKEFLFSPNFRAALFCPLNSWLYDFIPPLSIKHTHTFFLYWNWHICISMSFIV